MKWGVRRAKSSSPSPRYKKKKDIVNGIDINDDSFLNKYDKHVYRQFRKNSKVGTAVGSTFAGAIGAGQGAIIGSFGGPVGTAAGAVAGAALYGGGSAALQRHATREQSSAMLNEFKRQYYDNSKVYKRRKTVYTKQG